MPDHIQSFKQRISIGATLVLKVKNVEIYVVWFIDFERLACSNVLIYDATVE